MARRLPIPGQVRGLSFAAVLDEAMGRARRDPVRAIGPAGDPRPRVATPVLFGRPLTAPTPRWLPMEGAPRPRPAHRLDDRQRRAFDRFAALGATLSPGFTGDELAREYRRLARRYHPDRHVGCAPEEQAQWSHRFIEVAASYRCLRALVEPRH